MDPRLKEKLKKQIEDDKRRVRVETQQKYDKDIKDLINSLREASDTPTCLFYHAKNLKYILSPTVTPEELETYFPCNEPAKKCISFSVLLYTYIFRCIRN